MTNFDVSLNWTILLPPDLPQVNRAAEDLSRYIGVLAGLNNTGESDKTRGLHEVHGRNEAGGRKPPEIFDASGDAPPGPVIVLNSDGLDAAQNGFTWRIGAERVEIFGESSRGLCNGIYSFLSALGISWPAPGQEKLPSPEAKDLHGSSMTFSLTSEQIHEPSKYNGNEPAAAPWRRFVPDGKKTIKNILKKSEAFAAWAARKRYDAIVFPLGAFASGATGRKLKQLKQFAAEYDIALEAGGWDLSSLVPRKYFFFQKDFFRMEEGRRKKAHHFFPTNPDTIALIGKEGNKLFRAAEVKTFHLWPDKGEAAVWCSCPTCRAFTHAEQNRIAVNAAADVLSGINPNAAITYFEKSGEIGSIPLRKNLFRMERLPEEKEIRKQ